MDRNVSVGPGERLLEELVRAAQLGSPAELPVVVNRFAEAMGVSRAVVYLVDIQQRLLLPLVEGEPEFELDASLAGWAYRTGSLRAEEDHADGLNVWMPLADGAERLGVLGLNMDTLDGLKLRRCRTMALILALIITSKRTYSDTVAQRMRTRPMELPTEMVRAFLPPRSIGTGRVVSTAVLEPAYELGGDAFDHSFTEDVLHATILDGMGHNLASGLATSVAMAGCRCARADVRERISRAPVAGWHPFINRRAASLPSSSSTAPSTRPTVDRPVPIHTSTASPSVRSRWSTASPSAPSSTTVSAAGASTTEHPACSRSRYSTCSSAVILVSHATGRPHSLSPRQPGLCTCAFRLPGVPQQWNSLCPFLHFDHPPEPIDCTFRATT
ncbi:hypothetical protein OG930_43780 [Streptomyces sp. NBC_01799]|nr:hypothetical protein OG930_43780 [Streptomyces sp. NBC_01799]